MSALSDHDRRDAEDAARAEIRISVNKYIRRMTETTKTNIKEALDEASRSGEAVDGTALGRSAALRAANEWLYGGTPQATIEGTTYPSIES